MKKLIAIVAVVVVLAAAGWYFLAGRGGEGKPEILETAVVERGTVRKVLEATGIIKSEVGAQVKIGAQATGVITQMLVKIGDQVRKGDLIAVIDDRELKARLQEAEARLVREKAELDRVDTVFPLQIAEAEANLMEVQAQLDYARKNLERQRRLVEQDLEAVDVLDQAIQNADSLQSAHSARLATLNRLKGEFVRERLKREKAVREARASLDVIRVQISYTRIHSPLTGVVSQVAAQEGETIVSGLEVSNLITVLDPARLEMWIYVDETDVGQVGVGMPVEFTVDAYADRVFTGTIDRIYPEPEIRDNIVYYQAIVNLDRQQALQLRPEMTTQCGIVVEEKDGVLTIPNTALKWVGDRRVVFVGEPGGAIREVSPELGLQGLRESEILSGLGEGEKVATQLKLPGAGKKKAQQ